MGRIKTKLIKRNAMDIFKAGKGRFGNNFEANKKLSDELANIPSKKLRNVIAGHISKLVKKSALK
ncbi:MAG: 30S ribosomal protein S17e [Candidatus Nanoarchaeia archaeon]|nr:30S ribosomal protein S17e [Candidatus Nanoarchaeia archaeon]MDD5587924.1 30S ribosomal protein S17e [Candidatus Nanoarchaeia archaeon]